jgi:hypothetical protein
MLNASAQAPKGQNGTAGNDPRPHISDFIGVIARLAQVLAEEADALDKLQIRKVGEMQEEKLRLTALLEKCKKYYDRFPGELDTVSAADKEDFQAVVAVFNQVLKQNNLRLMVARELNRKMVEAIRDAVKEASTNRLYNGKGAASFAQRERLSVTLNQVI